MCNGRSGPRQLVHRGDRYPILMLSRETPTAKRTFSIESKRSFTSARDIRRGPRPGCFRRSDHGDPFDERHVETGPAKSVPDDWWVSKRNVKFPHTHLGEDSSSARPFQSCVARPGSPRSRGWPRNPGGAETVHFAPTPTHHAASARGDRPRHRPCIEPRDPACVDGER